GRGALRARLLRRDVSMRPYHVLDPKPRSAGTARPRDCGFHAHHHARRIRRGPRGRRFFLRPLWAFVRARVIAARAADEDADALALASAVGVGSPAISPSRVDAAAVVDARGYHCMSTPDEIVYLVDDDASVREALTDLLETEQITVLSFESAPMFLRH